MFICVDGSGPDTHAAYREAFAHSFLAQIIQHNTQTFARRMEGPTTGGGRQVDPRDLVNVITQRYDRGDDDRADTTVFLAGYSRGAATVVHVAALLERQGITVDAMFLFDAVDRSRSIGDSLPAGNVDVVTANVLQTYHAMRDPRAESRLSFSNTATSAVNRGSFHHQSFMTTHGGMGGCLWGYTGLERGRYASGDEYTSPSTTEAHRASIRHHALLWEGEEWWERDGEMLGATFTGSPSDSATSLTMDEEEAGAWRCIRWMWPHLLHHGVVRAGSSPRVHPNRGHFGERF